MIEITGLRKTFGVGTKTITALDGADLHIDPGMFGLLGPNGAGKTTLMRILAGIVNPSGGMVSVNGNDLTTNEVRSVSVTLTPYTVVETVKKQEFSE